MNSSDNPDRGQSISESPLSYANRLDLRDPACIDLVVIHCTELPDLALAREFGERVHYPESGTGHSGHFYIDRDGSIHAWVPLSRVAHHTRGYNDRSIGIELVNRGRWPDWFASDHQVLTEAYPDAQVEALVALLERLCHHLPGLCWIAGHEELDQELVPASDDPDRRVFRKRDPGPLFPWARVLDAVRLEPLPL
jgi:N-acetylmuramoyl-L-alanine amidase